jgi:hypothetical protein
MLTTLQPEVTILGSRKYSRCTRIVSEFMGMETN